MDASLTDQLLEVYDSLHRHYGYKPHWWPIFTGRRAWEVTLGSLLVQQTHWERVELAIQQLDARGLMDEHALAEAPVEAIVAAIRTVAFYNGKAPALKQLARYVVDHYGGKIENFLAGPTAEVRAELLRLPHIGPETADAILVYAGGHASFVVDAYLRRIFDRIGIVPGITTLKYEQIRQTIEAALPEELDLSAFPHLEGSRAHLFWDFHALIVEHGVHHCVARRPLCDQHCTPRRIYARTTASVPNRPACHGCPVRSVCAAYQPKQL